MRWWPRLRIIRCFPKMLGYECCKTRIPPGAIVPLHTHRWPGVAYILSWSHFIRRDQDGKVLLDTRRAGSPPKTSGAHWAAPLPPHTVENVGQSEISIVMVELKDTTLASAT